MLIIEFSPEVRERKSVFDGKETVRLYQTAYAHIGGMFPFAFQVGIPTREDAFPAGKKYKLHESAFTHDERKMLAFKIDASTITMLDEKSPVAAAAK